jgi:hypothetical protein
MALRRPRALSLYARSMCVCKNKGKTQMDDAEGGGGRHRPPRLDGQLPALLPPDAI